MRAASPLVDLLGCVALAVALLLASPGVRVSRADEDFSYDPALARAATEAAAAPAVKESGPTCAANQTLPAMPLRGIPIVAAGNADEPSSLNARGYNIGKAEPDTELQRLLFEARRH